MLPVARGQEGQAEGPVGGGGESRSTAAAPAGTAAAAGTNAGAAAAAEGRHWLGQALHQAECAGCVCAYICCVLSAQWQTAVVLNVMCVANGARARPRGARHAPAAALVRTAYTLHSHRTSIRANALRAAGQLADVFILQPRLAAARRPVQQLDLRGHRSGAARVSGSQSTASGLSSDALLAAATTCFARQHARMHARTQRPPPAPGTWPCPRPAAWRCSPGAAPSRPPTAPRAAAAPSPAAPGPPCGPPTEAGGGHMNNKMVHKARARRRRRGTWV